MVKISIFYNFYLYKPHLAEVINRPAVSGAVLKTPSSIIEQLTHPFPPNLQNIITPKLLEQET